MRPFEGKIRGRGMGILDELEKSIGINELIFFIIRCL